MRTSRLSKTLGVRICGAFLLKVTMKDISQKQLTSFVRSMKAALAKNHGITVPHTALRASYLQAMGENPHAFSGSATEATPVSTKLPAKTKGLIVKTLYLVDDDYGTLGRLALDADGDYPIGEDWQLEDATVEALFAEIPSVNKYGLPEYLSNPGPFFADTFGLSMIRPFNPEVKDLGDDSGDTCRIKVSMPRTQWTKLIYAVVQDAGQWADACEWVGLHYKKVLQSESEDQQTEWLERYVESQVEQGPSTVLVKFEWVYPDADSDFCSAMLNLATGRVTPCEKLPEIVYSSEVDQRIVLDEDGDEMFDVYLRTISSTSRVWHVSPESLEEIRALQD
jgi:hypothetical protein